MIPELIEKVCVHLSSKSADEWTGLNEIIDVFREYGLTDRETELALQFIKRFFLELDESGSEARLAQSFNDVFRE